LKPFMKPINDEQFCINPFVLRQSIESKFSHFEGCTSEPGELGVGNGLSVGWGRLLTRTIMACFEDKNVLPATRQGVCKVIVNPEGFWTSLIKIDSETPLEATFGSRRDDEESHLGTVSTGGKKQPAKYVEIILYHRDVLLEDDDDDDVSPEAWHIISINASPTLREVPMNPIARARNTLNMAGGTDPKLREKTKEELVALIEEMAADTIFHSQHTMVEPLQVDSLTVGPITIKTDGKGGGIIWSNDAVHDADNTPEDYPKEMAGVESFLLALAGEGVKVEGPRFERALETTLDAIDNNA
jgi:hypothetical protein